MMVRVLLFAQAAEAIGQATVDMELGAGATVADFRRQLQECYPQLESALPNYFVAVNHDYATNDRPLQIGDEIGVIPPVGGG